MRAKRKRRRSALNSVWIYMGKENEVVFINLIYRLQGIKKVFDHHNRIVRHHR